MRFAHRTRNLNPVRRHHYYVYMLTSSSRRALYTGVTNDLEFRQDTHRRSGAKTFAGRYRTFRLVYYEEFQLIQAAIAR
ncbi:MAG: GIY-YIG nuclease family protein, partial [Terriglobales bacterium]